MYKRNDVDLRSLLNKSYVPLEETKEGLLRGGFIDLARYLANNCDCNITLPNNCRCGDNKICVPNLPPNNCLCKGKDTECSQAFNNCNCYYQTATPPKSDTDSLSFGLFVPF